MDSKGILQFIGLAFLLSFIAVIIACIVAYFALGWRENGQFSTAIFWAAMIMSLLIYGVTSKVDSVENLQDLPKIHKRLWDNAFPYYLMLMLVFSIMLSVSILFLRF